MNLPSLLFALPKVVLWLWALGRAIGEWLASLPW